MARASVEQAFPVLTDHIEGTVSVMYQDVKGLVTTAQGYLIDPMPMALPLPFLRKADGQPASRAEIAAEWGRIKAADALRKIGWTAYARLATLYLAPASIAALTVQELRANEAQLRARWPGYDAWPAAAQLAVLSWAYASGSHTVAPHLDAELRASPPRFDLAAGEDGDPTTIPACRGDIWLRDAALVSAPGAIPIVETLTNPGLRPRNLCNRRLMAFAWNALKNPGDLEKVPPV